MRYFPLLLSASVALFTVPAAASVGGDASRNAIVVAYNSCPVYEGYPDCHPDEATSRATYSGYSRSASRARIRVR
jgi:hypothetical protein